jgi:SAM-dependent methyltransferase
MVWKLWRKLPLPLSEPVPVADTAAPSLRMVHFIDSFWCDLYGVYLKGWLHCYGRKIESLTVQIGEDQAMVSGFHDRPDVATHYPELGTATQCGFEVYLPCRPGTPMSFHVATPEGSLSVPVELPRRDPPPVEQTALFTDFVDMVNEQGLTVLEIGARIVGSISTDNRHLFRGAARYLGMDIHPSPTVDVVGDAHELSAVLGESAVDAIFSVAVLEHLEQPWLVAEEMNRTLKPGGIVFHCTVQAWPVHEYPNDFWRFSDQGLKVLFGPTFGFEVIGASMTSPVLMYPQNRANHLLQLPLNPGFAEICILSRKVSDMSTARGRDASELRRRSLQYPVHDSPSNSPVSTTPP